MVKSFSGSPSKINIMNEIRAEVRVGEVFDLLFRVSDTNDIPLSEVTFSVDVLCNEFKAECGTLRKSPTTDDDVVFSVQVKLLGSIQGNDLITLTLGVYANKEGQEAGLRAAQRSTIEKCKVTESHTFQVRHGAVSKLTISSLDGSKVRQLQSMDYTSGERLIFSVIAVDNFGNLAEDCMLHAKLVIADGDSKVAFEEAIRLTNGVASFSKLWPTKSSTGIITVEPVAGRRGVSRAIDGASCKLSVHRGKWASEMAVLHGNSKVLNKRIDLDDRGVFLDNLALQIMADDTTVYEGDVTASLTLQDTIVRARKEARGKFSFERLKVPSSPGDYEAVVSVQTSEHLPQLEDFTFIIRRSIGNCRLLCFF